MLELGTFGSVRGIPGNGYPYRNPRLTGAVEVVALNVSLGRNPTWSSGKGRCHRKPEANRRARPEGKAVK